MSDPDIYTIGWICAITTEFVAARAFLDEEHDGPTHVAQRDENNYSLGRIGKHNVVIAVLPDGDYGTASAAGVARDMLHSFPNIRIGLMVGIGGGAPTVKHDVRLGDIVVGTPRSNHGGVFQYDFGKTIQCQEFQATRFLDQPPTVLRTAVSGLKAQYEADGHRIQENIQAALDKKPRLRRNYDQPDTNTDRLYRANVVHPLEAETACLLSSGNDACVLVVRRARDELEDNPMIHYGLIASANQLMKDAFVRDKLAREKDVLCFEMEAAGLVNHFPCLVIRGICDYSDTHKNKQWQGYAAMTAAAYAKDILNRIPPNKVAAELKLSELLNEMHMDISAIRDHTSDTKNHFEKLRADEHHDRVRNWLAAPDPSTNLNRAREQYHKGTGQWFLHSEVYTNWKTEPNSFLWLYGIPGCGKTILSSSVVENLRQSAGSPTTLLYFYFDFNDVDKQSLDKAVRSLINQLYFQRKSARKETDHLYSYYDDGRRQPDQTSLRALLRNMLQHQNDCELYIVLDALDECHVRNEDAASGFMPYIKSLRDCTANVHLLVTSRPEHDLRSAIESWASDSEIIPLQSNRVKDDINSYIKAKVSQLSRWQKRPSIQNEIETALSHKANGMFRWVSCQFDILSRCLDPESIQRELAGLPQTLDETYERILKTIDPSRRDSAIRLLQFLTYSERPLTLAEAVDAVAVKISKEARFDPEYRMPCPEEIIGYCSSLAVLVKKRKVPWYTTRWGIVEEELVEIQLAHFSVQEYLLSDRLQGDIARELDFLSANTALTTVCLSYLLSLDHSGQPQETRKNYPLAQHSAQYWPTYAAVAEQSAKSILPVVREYFASMPAISFCCQLYDPDAPWAHEEHRPEASPGAALYYASLIGLRYSTQALIDDGANVNVEYGSQGHALLAAIYNGHHEIVHLLVEKGAKVDGQSKAYEEALLKAIKEEDQETTQILVDHGLNAQRTFGYTLPEAAWHGNEELVRLLINKGADVNKRVSWDDALDHELRDSSPGGDPEAVQLLLDNGADANVQCRDYENALQAALYEGHQEVAKTLIDNVVDVDVVDDVGNNASHAAVGYEFQENLRLVIDKEIDNKETNNNEIDNNDQYGEGIYTLLAASKRGLHEIVQSLVDEEVDDDYDGWDGIPKTALYAASARGHEAIAKILINQGADVNAQSGYFDHALTVASFTGDEAIVKTLLNNGAEVNAEGYWGTALQVASERGHTGAVKILLSHGADLNAEGGPFGKALQAAQNRRHRVIIRVLKDFKTEQDATHSGKPMVRSTAVHNQGEDSDQGQQTQSNKRKCLDSSSESISKRPRL